MPDMETSWNLATLLHRCRALTRHWSSTPLDAAGSMHVAHDAGSAPPVFWCFNTQQEFPALAQALGAEQPLVGMRSLNGVGDVTLMRSGAVQAMADYYAEQLFARFGQTPCIVGGNCQAAAFSYRIAINLLARGVPVMRLVTLDAEVRAPYPGHVRMVFGRNCTRYNPFLSAAPTLCHGPLAQWHTAYASTGWIGVSGKHGQYFRPDNVASVAQAIVEPTGRPYTHPQETSNLPDVRWRLVKTEPGSVTVETDPPDTNMPLAMVPVWRRSDGAGFRPPGERWIWRNTRTHLWRCRLPRPEHPDECNPWTLSLVLCSPGHGPLTWPVETFQILEID